jgi:hypothetical protein
MERTMQIKPEVKNMKVTFKEKVDPHASTAYTATTSATPINVTLFVPQTQSLGPNAVPRSTSAVVARKSD